MTTKTYKLGFLGAGNMAGAIYQGIVNNGLYDCRQIALCDTNEAKLKKYQQQGSGIFTSPEELAGDVEILVLSVKPQTFPEILPKIRSAVTEKTLMVSIAAGISVDYICQALGFPAKVVRVMPNTCLLLGAGATALSYAPPVTEEELERVRKIFDCAGVTAVISPDKMDEIIPVNGSSPAYILRFAKIFCEEAQKSGIDFDTANRLFAQTLIGTAKMMTDSGKSHQELMDMVTSPGGTTFAGLNALDAGQFDEALRSCFAATVKRSKELGALNNS